MARVGPHRAIMPLERLKPCLTASPPLNCHRSNITGGTRHLPEEATSVYHGCHVETRRRVSFVSYSCSCRITSWSSAGVEKASVPPDCCGSRAAQSGREGSRDSTLASQRRSPLRGHRNSSNKHSLSPGSQPQVGGRQCQMTQNSVRRAVTGTDYWVDARTPLTPPPGRMPTCRRIGQYLTRRPYSHWRLSQLVIGGISSFLAR
jgi:hypothetical protein